MKIASLIRLAGVATAIIVFAVIVMAFAWVYISRAVLFR